MARLFDRQAMALPSLRLLAGLAAMLMLAACQTAPTTTPVMPEPEPGAIYSGYFIWDSERDAGPTAVQCIRLVLTQREVLPDGRIRYKGVSRYVTGEEAAVDYATAELLFDPRAGRFEMRESDPTAEDFVTDGVFRGEMRSGGLFLDGLWVSDDAKNAQSGRLQLRSGADAPCRPDSLA